jgi:hypothetical protein
MMASYHSFTRIYRNEGVADPYGHIEREQMIKKRSKAERSTPKRRRLRLHDWRICCILGVVSLCMWQVVVFSLVVLFVLGFGCSPLVGFRCCTVLDLILL